MADTPAPDKPKPRRTKTATTERTPAKQQRRPAAKSQTAATKPAAERKSAVTTQAEKPKRAPRKPAAPKATTSRPAPAVEATPVPPSAPRSVQAHEAAPRLSWIAAAAGAIAAIGGALFLWRSGKAEEPDYEVIESDGAIEIRRYPALVTAAAEARGERRRALNEGFTLLADYIFAKSRRGPKLPMTAPVLSDGNAKHGWRTRFIMPTGIARANLPDAPAGVTLASEPAARIAAISFSGNARDETLATKENTLRSWLQTKGMPSEGKAVHAFYNAPFLPGPLRRNEVMIVLSDEGGTGGV